jgi:hypothetical protein
MVGFASAREHPRFSDRSALLRAHAGGAARSKAMHRAGRSTRYRSALPRLSHHSIPKVPCCPLNEGFNESCSFRRLVATH